MPLIGVLLVCQAFGDEQELPISTAAPPCGAEGRLEVSLHGSLRAKLDWTAADIECSGMPRPNNAGARLHFSGTALIDEKMRQIAIIIGLPELQRGKTVRETPAIVTIMDQDTGRFFNSSKVSFCLSDIEEHTTRAGGGEHEYQISGILYCVAALAEIRGRGDVSLTDLTFSGQVDWQIPK